MRDINSILKNFDWNTRRPFGWASSPDADWRVIFTGTVALIILVSVINMVVFMVVERGELFATKEEVIDEIPTLDTEELNKTLIYYQNKAVEFNRLTSGEGAVIVDPSL